MLSSSPATDSSFHWWSDVGRRIGGPASVTWAGCGISLGFTLVLGSMGAAAANAGWEWLAPALIGQFSAYGALWIARSTVLRAARDRPLPRRTIVCYGAAAFIGGNVAGAVTQSLSSSSTQAPPSPGGLVALLAVLATVVAFVLVSCFTAVVVDSWREHRAWSSRRLTLLDSLESLRTDGAAFYAQVRDEQRSFALEELQSLADVVPDTPLHELAQLAHDAANEIIRPLSHRLAFEDSPVPPTNPPTPATFRDFLLALRHQPLLRPLPLALLSIIPPGFLVLFNATTVPGIVFVVLSAVSVFAASHLFVMLIRAAQRLRSTLLLWGIGVALLATIPALVAAIVLDDKLVRAASVTGSFSIIVFAILGPTLSVARVAFEHEHRERHDLEQRIEIESRTLRRRDRLERDKLTKILHGRVQSSLLACALRLSSADHSDTAVVDRTRVWVRGVLELMSDLLAQEAARPNLATGMRNLRSLWDGLCIIDVDLGHIDVLELDPDSCDVVLAVIEELCVNAIRHGAATRVTIELTPTSSEILEISVRADAHKEQSRAGRGLGSRLLDTLTQSWSVDISDTHVHCIAVVPVNRVSSTAVRRTRRRNS